MTVTVYIYIYISAGIELVKLTIESSHCEQQKVLPQRCDEV